MSSEPRPAPPTSEGRAGLRRAPPGLDLDTLSRAAPWRAVALAGVWLPALLAVAHSGCGPGPAGADSDAPPPGQSSLGQASPGPSSARTVYRGSHPIRVVATTGMVADLAANVGGASVSVEGLMGEGVDPHLYKASPGDLHKLAQADFIVYSGLHLEGRMADVFSRLTRIKPTLAVAETLPAELLRSPPEFKGQHDPHVWFDVSLWARCVQALGEELAAFDPPLAAGYRERAAAYHARLEALHREVKEELAQIPPERRVLVTAHDAFGYFGRAYGVEVRGIQGVSTDSEAGIREIGKLVDFLVERKIKAVFVETSVSERNVRALVEGCHARGHPVVVGGQLYSDAMGKPGTDEGTYEGMVRHNVRIMVKALR